MAAKIFFDFMVVALGGALGSVCRYASGLLFTVPGNNLPWGTLLANLVGSLVIGFVMELATVKAGLAPELRLFLVTGFCGGLTTLSSLVFEANSLGRDREFLLALAYGVGTLFGAILALWVGILLCRLFFVRN